MLTSHLPLFSEGQQLTTEKGGRDDNDNTIYEGVDNPPMPQMGGREG